MDGLKDKGEKRAVNEYFPNQGRSMGASLHRRNPGQMPTGAGGGHQKTERATPGDDPWVGTVVHSRECKHRQDVCKATIWLSREHLTIEFGDEARSQFAVQYQPDEKHLCDIKEPHHFETSYRSPQLDLWQQGEVEWHLVRRLPDYDRNRPKGCLTHTQSVGKRCSSTLTRNED